MPLGRKNFRCLLQGASMWVPPVPALAARNSCLNSAPTRPTRGCGQRATRRTLTGPRCELGLHPRIQREAAQTFRHRGYVADPFVDVHLHVMHSQLFCAQSDFPEDRHATGGSCVTLYLSRRDARGCPAERFEIFYPDGARLACERVQSDAALEEHAWGAKSQ